MTHWTEGEISVILFDNCDVRGDRAEDTSNMGDAWATKFLRAGFGCLDDRFFGGRRCRSSFVVGCSPRRCLQK